MKYYNIRITTANSIYKDFLVEADNLFFAKIKARNIYFKENPKASKDIKLSLVDPNPKVITEIMNIIKEG